MILYTDDLIIIVFQLLITFASREFFNHFQIMNAFMWSEDAEQLYK